MTTKYVIRYYNISCKRWGVYHITHDMSDAYAVHRELQGRGYEASITSEYVNEVLA